jgi:hypothetical protein
MNYTKLYVQSAFARFASCGGQPSPSDLPTEARLRIWLACQAEAAPCFGAAKAGADDRNRTGDLVLTKDALCQLSYIGLRATADKSAAPTPNSSPGIAP